MEKGTVIQISPETQVRDGFKGLFAVVSEVREWGVIAYCPLDKGIAWVRINNGDFVIIGTAEWMVAE